MTVGIANVLDIAVKGREESKKTPRYLNGASNGLVVTGTELWRGRRAITEWGGEVNQEFHFK